MALIKIRFSHSQKELLSHHSLFIFVVLQHMKCSETSWVQQEREQKGP